MAELKYDKYVVTELKTPDFPEEFVTRYNEFARRILWMDANVVEGAFQMNCSWYMKPSRHATESHTHNVDEILGFFGSDPVNPYDLGGEVELWLEGEQHIITRTSMVFIPAGMDHCPLIIRRVDRPIFHFSTVLAGSYVQGREGEPVKYESKDAEYIVSELKIPEEKQKIAAEYAKYATRILWLDENVVEGAFHMNTAWYLKAGATLEDAPHTHESDEIIGFFGSNPDDRYDMGGEIEIWMEDEQYILNRTTMLFVPAGLKHCPLTIRRVDRPIFHFTTVPGGQYIKDLK